MATVDELLRQAREARGELTTLRQRYSHSSSYLERRHLLTRIRAIKDRLDALNAAYLRAESGKPATVFNTRKKARKRAGLAVRVDISTDGRYFSNPAPSISNTQRVWVRCQIDIAQKSAFATKPTLIPELVRCTWKIPRGWTILDRYSRFGRVEHVVSLPLVITREFKAPSSGTTKARFGVYVDPYYPVDTDWEPPDTGQVEVTTVTASIDAGTYYVYTRTGNVLSSRASIAWPDSTIQVEEADEKLFYTDGNTNLVLREMLTGPYPGKYMNIAQDGITLEEVIGDLGVPV